MNPSAHARLWNLAQLHTFSSGGQAAARVLLGLYDGERFPMNLNELGALIGGNRSAALELIAHCTQHQRVRLQALLNSATGRSDFQDRLEHLAWDYGMRGRKRPKKSLQALSPATVVFGNADE